MKEEGIAFPRARFALGPLKTVKTVLLAMHRREFETLRPFLVAEDAGKILSELPEEIDEIERSAGKEYGITLETVAKDFLPRLDALPGRCGAMELRFEFVVTAGGRAGRFEMDFDLRVEGEDEPVWKLEDIDADFKPLDEGKPAPAAGAERVAPEGLRKALEPFALPDFSAFPAGTDRVELKCRRRIGRRGFRIESDFRAPEGEKGLAFAEFRVREDECEGAELPAAPFGESAIQSLRVCLEAMRKGDLDEFLKYMDSGARKELESIPREDAIRMLRDAPKEEAYWGRVAIVHF